MKDKHLLKELDKLAQEWIKNNNIIDGDLLRQMFKMEGGNIFTNDKEKIAVGFLPFPGTLEMYFFEVTKDDRLKYVTERGIVIDEGSKAALLYAIKLCELRHNADDDHLGDNSFQ
jgi:hypothetical protein